VNADSTIPLLFVVAVTVATVLLGIYATRKARTASDFFVAGRSVGVLMNASAISGEYLSAASFMGVAGLIMKSGYDALWYPVCYAAGYLFLLLFIAGPLRRFGAYTIPDFAQGRFDSPEFRKVAVIFVLLIGFFYTMPQMKGAGVTMSGILGWPYWVGILVVGTVITFNVAIGGMKGITLVQAFQYWAKIFAISVPAFILIGVYGPQSATPASISTNNMKGSPRLKAGTKVKVKGIEGYPNNSLSFSPGEPTYFTFPDGAELAKVAPARKPEPGEDRIGVLHMNVPPDPNDLQRAFLLRSAADLQRQLKEARGKLQPTAPEILDLEKQLADLSKRLLELPSAPDNSQSSEKTFLLYGTGFARPEVGKDGAMTLPKGATLYAAPVVITKNGEGLRVNRALVKTAAKIEFKKATTVVMGWANRPALSGSAAPNAPTNGKWLAPYGPAATKWGFPVLYTYSLIIALVCGTAGLPHILVRFYTNPDGRAAKRTTLWVMVMLGVFYVFTPVWGTLGRALMPSLYSSSGTDVVLIKLPTIFQDKTFGNIMSGITSAGAFAAFMSTFSGLLVSMSGAFAHDIYGKMIRPQATPEQRISAFKVAAVFVGLISMGLGLFVETFDIATMVGWAFAIGAASYFPLLLLGSWWRGLTKQGAQAGMLLGGLLSLFAIVSNMLLDKKVLTWDLPPLVRSLMEQPAIWGVPLSIVTMVVVSKMTAASIPADVEMKMLRLHAPEELGFSRDYVN